MNAGLAIHDCSCRCGISCSANAVLTDIVKRVERNELKPDPRHITELRLN
jgi:2-dehydropantoate 2-reductase